MIRYIVHKPKKYGEGIMLSDKSLPILCIILLPIIASITLHGMVSFSSPDYYKQLQFLATLSPEQIQRIYRNDSLYILGLKLFTAPTEDQKDRESGFEKIAQAAQNGSLKAQRTLAMIYYLGQGGIPKSNKMAFEWFRKAADQDDGYSLMKIFYLPFTTKGKKIFDEVPEWEDFIKNSKNQDHLKTLSKNNDPDGQFGYANLLLFGDLFDKNVDNAVKLLKKAALKENIFASEMLGRCYKNGIGVEKDSEKALELFKKTALFLQDARFNLAMMYIEPQKPYTNMDEGKKILEGLCAKLDGASCTQITLLEISSKNSEPDYYKAFQKFQDAYSYGDDMALYFMAALADEGFGPTEDPHLGQELYQKILDSKNKSLNFAKGLIYELGLLESKGKDIATAKEYYTNDDSEISKDRLRDIAQEELEKEFSIDVKKLKKKKKGKSKAEAEDISGPTPYAEEQGSSSGQETLPETDIDIAGEKLKNILNSTPFEDKSYISDFDTEQKVVTIVNPYNNSKIMIQLKIIKPVTPKKLAQLKPYNYAPRVREWFQPKNLRDKNLEQIERHRFAQRVDQIVQLYGKLAYFPTGGTFIKNTILPGQITLADGTTLAGKFEFTVNEKGELYHRFLHPRTRAILRN